VGQKDVISACKIIILGPPGAGKGTQAELISQKLGIPHIATGDILRDEAKRKTRLGQKAKEYMVQGLLVPDDLVIAIVKKRLAEAGKDGFILDGFPRTREQAEALEDFTNLDLALNIKLSATEIVRRLSSRRVCEDCGRNYNLVLKPPKQEGRCDLCGGRLFQRPDDRPEVIKQRYEVYTQQSAPLVQFYKERSILREIDGEKAVEDVLQNVLKAIKNNDND